MKAQLAHIGPLPGPHIVPLPKPDKQVFAVVDGEKYPLTKRTAGRRSSYTVRFMWNGKRVRHSLKTNDRKVAVERAEAYIRNVRAGKWSAVEMMNNRHTPGTETATIGQLLQAYEKATHLNVGEKAQKANPQALRNCIRRALGMPIPAKDASFEERAALNAEVNAMNSNLLTEPLARNYWRAMREAANIAEKVEGQEAAQRVRITWASLLSQGISVFQPACQLMYKDAGLILPPTLGDFLLACKAEKPKGLVARYNPPPERVIQTTLHDWVKLEDRRMFLAIGLELSFGLRKSEIPQILWGMITAERGRPLLDSRRVMVKNQLGQIIVPPLDPFWLVMVRRIRRDGWKGNEGDALVDGGKTELDDLFRGISEWMRSRKWETEKTNHALRAYSGSLVAMKWGIWRASAWLRHATVKTTQGNYSHFINARKGLFRPEDVRVRWGRVLL